MKNNLKGLLNTYKKSRYDRIVNARALTALNHIENNTGYKLPSKMKKEIDKYTLEMFGSTSYAPWLYVYTAYNQEFKEGWIPDNFFGYIVAPIVNKGLGPVANMKTLSNKILQTDKLPDKFYIIDNTIYDEGYNAIPKKDVEKKLFSVSKEYFLKLDNSNQGKGVVKIRKQDFNMEEILNKGDAVLQTPIIQSKFFDEILNDNVATLRIITCKNGNKIRFAASFLRVGRKSDDIVQAKSAINIPIIDEYGTLNEFANDIRWGKYYEHPDTGYRFARNQIPHFENAVQDCINIHQKIPHVTIIAWDVSITDEGNTVIIEWNAKHPGITYVEAFFGPLFRGMDWEHLN